MGHVVRRHVLMVSARWRARIVAISRHAYRDEYVRALLAALGLAAAPVRVLRREPAVIEVDLPSSPVPTNAHDVPSGWDIAWLPPRPLDWSRVVVALDMDSTLIEQEVIDELARAHGVFDAVREVTERAMRGELDFRASLSERLARLADFPVAHLARVGAQIRLSAGARTLFATLRARGATTAIISGGFHFVGRVMQHELAIDHCFAHDLEAHEGRLTGRVAGPVIDADGKADRLSRLAERHGADVVVAAGDGANDAAMLTRATIGVAYRAKPALRAAADARIDALDLTAILHFLGVPVEDFVTPQSA